MPGPRIMLRASSSITGADQIYSLQPGSSTHPRLYFIRPRPDKNVEVTTAHFHGKDISWAWLHVYEASVFIEAKDSDVWILPAGWKPHRSNNWDRILLKQSSPGRQMLVRLRPLDTFMAQTDRFLLEYLDANDDPYDSQADRPVVVKLEGESQLSMGAYEDNSIRHGIVEEEYLPYPQDLLPHAPSEGPRHEEHQDSSFDLTSGSHEFDKENKLALSDDVGAYNNQDQSEIHFHLSPTVKRRLFPLASARNNPLALGGNNPHNSARNKFKPFRSIHRVTLDKIHEKADSIGRLNAMKAGSDSDDQDTPLLNSEWFSSSNVTIHKSPKVSKMSEVPEDQQVYNSSYRATDDTVHAHPSRSIKEARGDGAESPEIDSDSTVQNGGEYAVTTRMRSFPKLRSIPQIDGSSDGAAFETAMEDDHLRGTQSSSDRDNVTAEDLVEQEELPGISEHDNSQDVSREETVLDARNREDGADESILLGDAFEAGIDQIISEAAANQQTTEAGPTVGIKAGSDEWLSTAVEPDTYTTAHVTEEAAREAEPSMISTSTGHDSSADIDIDQNFSDTAPDQQITLEALIRGVGPVPDEEASAAVEQETNSTAYRWTEPLRRNELSTVPTSIFGPYDGVNRRLPRDLNESLPPLMDPVNPDELDLQGTNIVASQDTSMSNSRDPVAKLAKEDMKSPQPITGDTAEDDDGQLFKSRKPSFRGKQYSAKKGSPSPSVQATNKRRSIPDSEDDDDGEALVDESSIVIQHTVHPKKKRKTSSLSQEAETVADDSSPNSTRKSKVRGASTGSSKKPTPTPRPRERRQSGSASTQSGGLRSSGKQPKEEYTGSEPRIVFSSTTSVGTKPNIMKFLKSKGGKKVESIVESTMLCVGKAELKKTAKLILAITSGKDIVVDTWLTESAKSGTFLDIKSYFPSDEKHEKEWKVNLLKAVQRGKDGVKPLEGFKIFFSPALKKAGGNDLKEVALTAGAEWCHTAPKTPADDLLVLLTGEKDKDGEILARKGFRTYSKELLTLGILRETLDLDGDEFNLGLDESDG